MENPIPQQIQALSAQYPADGKMRIYCRFDRYRKDAENNRSGLSGWRYAFTQDWSEAVSGAIGVEITEGPWVLGWSGDGIQVVVRSEDITPETRAWARRLHALGRGW